MNRRAQRSGAIVGVGVRLRRGSGGEAGRVVGKRWKGGYGRVMEDWISYWAEDSEWVVSQRSLVRGELELELFAFHPLGLPRQGD